MSSSWHLLSLLLPSILMILFIYIFQTLNNYIFKTDSSIAYLSLTLFEIICIIASAKISQISGIATILVSANTNISPQDLYSRIQTTIRRSTVVRRSSWSGGIGSILAAIVLMLVIFMAIFSPNAITISIAVVVGISVLHASVATGLSRVVSVVEEKFEGSEALEKAQQLIIQGQGKKQQQGFMINLFLYLLALIIIMGFCFVSSGAAGSLLSVNLMELGLCLVIVLSLANIYWCVAYTVFYFQCNNVGDFDYSVLPASNLA